MRSVSKKPGPVQLHETAGTLRAEGCRAQFVFTDAAVAQPRERRVQCVVHLLEAHDRRRLCGANDHLVAFARGAGVRAKGQCQ